MADILVIDDQDRTLALCRRSCPEHQFLGPARHWREAEMMLTSQSPALVILDVVFAIPEAELLGFEKGTTSTIIERLRRHQGFRILKEIRKRWPYLPVMLTTTQQDVPLGAMDTGVEEQTYFLEDDALDARVLKQQIEAILRETGLVDDGIYWGKTPAMRRVRRRLLVLARGRLPVMVLGPTGTGKSLIARQFIHERSGRKGAFIAVDLSTVPRDLLAAHLFGSVKGAYTGAISDRIGAFEAADGGTLFLDEIGNLTPEAQKMLLGVLQEGKVIRVGDLRERPVDVKLVVATHENLAERVQRGELRADLYMRLNPAAAVVLPSLLERQADFDELLRFSLEQILDQPQLSVLVSAWKQRYHGKAETVSIIIGGEIPPLGQAVWLPERTLIKLKQSAWPGNLRELSSVLENSVLFALAELEETRNPERVELLVLRPEWLLGISMSVEKEAALSDSKKSVMEPGLVLNGSTEYLFCPLIPASSLNQVALNIERYYFESLYIRENGDFSEMARVLLNDADGARKVQLRFNQLGLKVRDLKERMIHPE